VIGGRIKHYVMNNYGEKKTPIGRLGKYGLIDLLTKNASNRNKSSVSVIGDDSAVIDSGRLYTLITSDLLLEGIHFNLIYTPLKHLGYKTVIRAISDIYAMNGTPGQVLITIGISSRFSVEQISELYDGVYLACDKYSVDLAGGDTTSSLTGLTIGVTAAGTVEQGKIVRRNGAKPNDLICVTGDFGAAYMGLQLLEREKKLFENNKGIQPDLAGHEYIIGRQLKPEFPFNILNDLNEKDILPTSMIDVSDGLASDLLQICKASAVGCRIFSNKIPVDNETLKLAGEFRIDPVIPALNGGEDYELLFTVPLGLFEKIRLVQSVRVIGHITQADAGKYLVSDDGSEVELTAQGWRD
jgi:thiamine-monophosphate kinase